MALSERAKWDRFIAKHGPVKSDAFWWCSGKRWAARRYCVVLLAKSRHDPPWLCALELRADTPAALVALVAAAGYHTTVATVARMCETAGRSPKRPRKVPRETSQTSVADVESQT
jgi:hypothetical protein